MPSTVYYKPKSEVPLFSVKHLGSRNLGRCFNEVTYEVTLSRKPMDRAMWSSLYTAGIFAGGQSTSVCQTFPDGRTAALPDKVEWNTKVEPSYAELAYPVEVDDLTGAVISEAPVNKWSGKPCEPSSTPMYTYRVTVQIDSGD